MSVVKQNIQTTAENNIKSISAVCLSDVLNNNQHRILRISSLTTTLIIKCH